MERCMCGDPYCSSCGTAQGTYPTEPDDYEEQEAKINRLLELLADVAGSGIAYTNPGNYHEVQISLITWDAINAELRGDDTAGEGE